MNNIEPKPEFCTAKPKGCTGRTIMDCNHKITAFLVLRDENGSQDAIMSELSMPACLARDRDDAYALLQTVIREYTNMQTSDTPKQLRLPDDPPSWYQAMNVIPDDFFKLHGIHVRPIDPAFVLSPGMDQEVFF